MDVDRVDQRTTSLKARSPWGGNSRLADKASHSVKKRAKAINPLMETRRQSISIKVQMNCHFSPRRPAAQSVWCVLISNFTLIWIKKKCYLVLFGEIFHKWNINITKCTFIGELWINFKWDSISMAHPSWTPQSTLQTCNINAAPRVWRQPARLHGRISRNFCQYFIAKSRESQRQRSSAPRGSHTLICTCK